MKIIFRARFGDLVYIARKQYQGQLLNIYTSSEELGVWVCQSTSSLELSSQKLPEDNNNMNEDIHISKIES